MDDKASPMSRQSRRNPAPKCPGVQLLVELPVAKAIQTIITRPCVRDTIPRESETPSRTAWWCYPARPSPRRCGKSGASSTAGWRCCPLAACAASARCRPLDSAASARVGVVGWGGGGRRVSVGASARVDAQVMREPRMPWWTGSSPFPSLRPSGQLREMDGVSLL